MGQPRPLFVNLRYFQTLIFQKYFKFYQDSNSGCRGRRQARWPLDHYHGPNSLNFVTVLCSVQYLCKPKLMHCTEKAFLWVIIFICKGSADRGSERKKPQILIRQNHDLNVIFVLKVFVSLIKQLTFWLNVNCRRASLNDYVQNLPSSRQFFSLLSYWWHKLSTAIKWQ